MTPEQISSLVSSVGGLCIGAFGLYVAYRSRTSPLRDRLYSAQIELLVRVLELSHKMTVGAHVILDYVGSADEKQNRALFDKQVGEFQGLAVRGLVILPHKSAESLFELTTLLTAVSEPENPAARGVAMSQVSAAFSSFYAVARHDLGVDPLSKDIQALQGSLWPRVRIETK